MFIWVRYGTKKELVNINCTGYCLLDHILHQYGDDDILPKNEDGKWPQIISEFDLADENGYICQLNKYLGEMANTVVAERETYILLRMATGDDGKSIYTPLIDQEEEEAPFVVKDAVKPRGVGISRPKKTTKDRDRERDRDRAAGAGEKEPVEVTSHGSGSARRAKSRANV